MLNKINSISFCGRITLRQETSRTCRAVNYNTSLDDDRLIKLTANSICQPNHGTQLIDDKFAKPFLKLIEKLTNNNFNINSSKYVNFITNTDNKVVLEGKGQGRDKMSVNVTLDTNHGII